MADVDKITFPNVTPEQVKLLREYFQEGGGTGCDGDSGLAENPAFAARYDYDRASGLLTLEPTRMVDSLNPKRVQRAVAQVLSPESAEASIESVGERIYKPAPTPCGSATWAIAYVTNNTDSVLTLGRTKAYPEGDSKFKPVVKSIPVGNKPASQKNTGVFQHRGSTGGSMMHVMSVNGRVDYRLDASWNNRRHTEVLYIDYSVGGKVSSGGHFELGSGKASASVTLAGFYLDDPPPIQHRATAQVYERLYMSCVFLYPYVTIERIAG